MSGIAQPARDWKPPHGEKARDWKPPHGEKNQIFFSTETPARVTTVLLFRLNAHLNHLVEVQALRADDQREAADQLGNESVLDEIRGFRLQEPVRLTTPTTHTNRVVCGSDFQALHI